MYFMMSGLVEMTVDRLSVVDKSIIRRVGGTTHVFQLPEQHSGHDHTGIHDDVNRRNGSVVQEPLEDDTNFLNTYIASPVMSVGVFTPGSHFGEVCARVSCVHSSGCDLRYLCCVPCVRCRTRCCCSLCATPPLKLWSCAICSPCHEYGCVLPLSRFLTRCVMRCALCSRGFTGRRRHWPASCKSFHTKRRG